MVWPIFMAALEVLGADSGSCTLFGLPHVAPRTYKLCLYSKLLLPHMDFNLPPTTSLSLTIPGRGERWSRWNTGSGAGGTTFGPNCADSCPWAGPGGGMKWWYWMNLGWFLHDVKMGSLVRAGMVWTWLINQITSCKWQHQTSHKSICRSSTSALSPAFPGAFFQAPQAPQAPHVPVVRSRVDTSPVGSATPLVKLKTLEDFLQEADEELHLSWTGENISSFHEVSYGGTPRSPVSILSHDTKKGMIQGEIPFFGKPRMQIWHLQWGIFDRFHWLIWWIIMFP